LNLSCFHPFSVSWLRALLFSVTWILLILSVILTDLLNIRNLSQSTLAVGFACLSYFSGSCIFIFFFFFEEIFCSSRYFIFWVNLNKIFLKTEARKRIEKIIAKLLVNILFDFLLKDLKLGFFLKFHYILNIPLRCEGSLIITSSSINGLYDFFMLIIKSLNWSWNKIIRADTFLHVFTIVDVFFLDIFILLFIACWRKEKCEDCLCLLEFNWNVCLKIFSSEFLLIFFYCFGFFFKFILRLGFRFIRWHERFFLVHRATFLHLRVILF